MPNIYLRLPTSRCQFFRHRDPKHTLAKDEPLVFSPYMPHHFVLRKYLTNIPAVAQKVLRAKTDGLIDQFIYTSISASYLLGVMETL